MEKAYKKEAFTHIPYNYFSGAGHVALFFLKCCKVLKFVGYRHIITL